MSTTRLHSLTSWVRILPAAASWSLLVHLAACSASSTSPTPEGKSAETNSHEAADDSSAVGEDDPASASGGSSRDGGKAGTAGGAHGDGGAGAGSTAEDGGATSDGAGATPADPNAKVLALTSFTVDPGAEVYMCQNFDNPFGGEDAAVSRIVSDMTPGSHHLHVFYGATDGTRELQPCSGFEFHPLLHAAGTPHLTTDYKAGMAAKLKGSSGLRLQVHYLNASSKPLKVDAKVSFSTVDASTVSRWIAELYYNRLTLTVPPGVSSTATTCTVASNFGPIGLVGGGSHMHSRGTHFVATTSTGVKLYETKEWDAPEPVDYDPPIALKPGDKITWTCTYDNQTGTTLQFGEHADTNEMCIFLARFYSSPNGDDLQCQAYYPTQ